MCPNNPEDVLNRHLGLSSLWIQQHLAHLDLAQDGAVFGVITQEGEGQKQRQHHQHQPEDLELPAWGDKVCRGVPICRRIGARGSHATEKEQSKTGGGSRMPF
jgi:hypothetical protein